MQKTLAEMKPSESGVIVSLSAEGKIKRRLFDMGVTPGAEVTVRKLAPLGDPMDITIRNYQLSLRKLEAACVVVEVK